VARGIRSPVLATIHEESPKRLATDNSPELAMLPKKIIKKIVGRLMAASRECQPFDSAVSTAMFYSNKHNQYGLDSSWEAEFKELAAACSRWLDQYPLQHFERFLQTAVADATETGTPADATFLRQHRRHRRARQGNARSGEPLRSLALVLLNVNSLSSAESMA
jgi:hypothetical protein